MLPKKIIYTYKLQIKTSLLIQDNTKSQPWIGNPATDIIFILLPPFICLLIIAIFPDLFQEDRGMSTMTWIILILLIDVAHVYSTLYRTYFDPASFKAQKSLLFAIPFCGLIAGMLLYSFSPLSFWRVLAYVAVYHFIRQQYGFMRVYSRKDKPVKISALIDTITIYIATIYPIIYWHLSGPRNFNWFVEGDFMYREMPGLLGICTFIYWVIVIGWLIKEVFFSITNKHVNIPKNLMIIGTLLSWYFGIVYFDGDLTFTLLNVVSHGIPYMALVWLYGNKRYLSPGKGTRFLRLVFSRVGVLLFLVILFVLAFVEEGIWDIAVWKEREGLFDSFDNFQVSPTLLSILVPILALPQITHYILDGFIWKVRKGEFDT